MATVGRFFVWALLLCLVAVPVVIAALSPLQHSRDFVYVAGGLAGVTALSLLLLQPLLATGYLPGLSIVRARVWHRRIGIALVFAVLVHIGGLYLASPPDMIDALLLVAPTPFSVYGVIGLWGIILTVVLVAIRSLQKLQPRTWHLIHNIVAVVVVGSSVIHAWLIQGAMGSVSKLMLCISVVIVTAVVTFHFRIRRLPSGF